MMSLRSNVGTRPALSGARVAAPKPRAMRAARASVTVKAELQVGDNLSQYAEYYRALKSTDGGAVSLASFKGKQPVVLFFYPKAGTPGCTKEACAFRDSYAQFTDAGAAVFGISGDSLDEQDAFKAAQSLPYPLLADASDVMRKVFGIKGDLLGFLPGRQTYVFDKNSKCVMAFNDQFQPEKHVDEALQVLKNLA